MFHLQDNTYLIDTPNFQFAIFTGLRLWKPPSKSTKCAVDVRSPVPRFSFERNKIALVAGNIRRAKRHGGVLLKNSVTVEWQRDMET